MKTTGETIELHNLSIGYHTKHGVKTVATNISGTIKSGELTCLLGANGVGKSTLLKTLSSFQPKTDGEILLQGRELSEYSDKQLSRLIGVVLTEKPDVRNMDDLQVVDEAIAMVGIEALSKRMVHTLSDGERQKVMIAKALAQQTPVIYLDEPTAFLDYPSKVEVLQLLSRISREADKIIFLSTHDVELALQMADTIWLMTKEEQMAIGSPKALAEQGTLGRFIERDGIAFDPATMAIKVTKRI